VACPTEKNPILAVLGFMRSIIKTTSGKNVLFIFNYT
jgi:hypothetical protein